MNHRQSVADHSFYVAVYADGLAEMLGWTEDQRLHLLRAALWHDADEVVSGDIPGPVKREIPDRPQWNRFIQDLTVRHFGNYPMAQPDEKDILTAANLFDECAYLAGEVRSGNKHAAHALTLSDARLRKICQQINVPELLVDQFMGNHLAMDTPLPGE